MWLAGWSSFFSVGRHVCFPDRVCNFCVRLIHHDSVASGAPKIIYE